MSAGEVAVQIGRALWTIQANPFSLQTYAAMRRLVALDVICENCFRPHREGAPCVR